MTALIFCKLHFCDQKDWKISQFASYAPATIIWRQMRYHCRTDVKCIVFCIWRHMVKVGRHVSDLTSIVSKSRNQQTTKWWDLGQSQSWANEAKRRRAVDWIEYTPVPSYLYLDLRIYLFSCILTPWKRLKLLLNLFYSCKIALKIFFPRGTEAVGRRQE